MRSIFDWECPPGVRIEQRFEFRYTDEARRNHIVVTFVAVCDACGTATSPRAARSDALDDLDAIVCPASTAVESPA